MMDEMFMNKRMRRIWNAIEALQGNEHFDIIIEWLEQDRAEWREQLPYAVDVVQVRLIQGRLQALDDLLKNFTQARELRLSLEEAFADTMQTPQ